MFPRNIDSILDILTNFTIIPNRDYGEVESGFQRAYLPFGRGQGDSVPLKSIFEKLLHQKTFNLVTAKN
jgi:hypothetical protein